MTNPEAVEAMLSDVSKEHDEFNLSEKRIGINGNSYYPEEDVKEFIRRQLCPICQKVPENNCDKCREIKADAGDKLK